MFHANIHPSRGLTAAAVPPLLAGRVRHAARGRGGMLQVGGRCALHGDAATTAAGAPPSPPPPPPPPLTLPGEHTRCRTAQRTDAKTPTRIRGPVNPNTRRANRTLSPDALAAAARFLSGSSSTQTNFKLEHDGHVLCSVPRHQHGRGDSSLALSELRDRAHLSLRVYPVS